VADDLVVRLKAEDELSQRVREAEKNVRSLKKELIAAAKEADSSGDYSRVRELEDQFRQASGQVGNLRGELKKLQRESKTTADATVKNAGMIKTAWSKLQKVMQNPLVTAVSIGAITLFAKSAIQSFSEVQDSTDALIATFGESGDRLVAWANESALAFNLSKKEALSAIQTIAIFGESAGLAGEEMEQFAISLTERAADAASFFGGTTADAVQAFGAALRGEMEPIRRYAVMLDDLTLRNKAFEMGLIETTKQALTPQQKILAAHNAIMEQTVRVQGDVARTSDSMANQIKQGQAQFENLKSTVGETLAIALGPILKSLNGVLSIFNGLPGPIKSVVVGLAGFAAALLVIGPRIATMITGMRAAGVEATVLKGKMAAAGSFMIGPWGAALAVGAAALTYFMTEQAEANARVDEFATLIDNATGKLTEAGIVKVLEDLRSEISSEDWAKLAEVGITIDDVAAAVIGGEKEWEAYDRRLQDVMGTMRTGSGGLYDTIGIVRSNLAGERKDLAAGTREWQERQRVLEKAAQATREQTEAEKRKAYTSGTVLAALQKVNPALGTYRGLAYSSSFAASALKVANQGAADATDRLGAGLSNLAGIISEQQALASYQTALDAFIKEPSEETALAVSSAMQSAAQSIKDPGEQAAFTKTAVNDIRTAASDAGMKLNPKLDEGLRIAKGNAKLLETQIDRAVRARTVVISTRFVDSRQPSSSGRGDGPRHGGYTDGWINGPGGPTSDYAPIWASRGEYVLRAGAAAALRQAIGDSGMWQLNHADRSMPSFMDSPVPPMITNGNGEPALVGAGAPVINIGEITAASGIDVQSEVVWALRRAERIKRERGA
jgi:hypothetical protein